MRFREGMRRVSLAVGMLGFFGGCWFSASVPGSEISDARRWQRAMRVPMVRTVLGQASKQGIVDAILHIESLEISTIRIDKNGQVTSFVKTDGSQIFRPEAITIWPYFSLALWPILGFLIPWGGFRFLTWIISGFLDPPTQSA